MAQVLEQIQKRVLWNEGRFTGPKLPLYINPSTIGEPHDLGNRIDFVEYPELGGNPTDPLKSMF